MSGPPNLLFVFADEMRGSALGCCAHGPALGARPPSGRAFTRPDVRTPHLDRLAAEGVRFTDAVANDAVCTPARGCILTGCWPQTHGALANDLPVDPAAPSISRVLGGAGYRCGYIGKWHLGGIPRDRFIPPGAERLGFDDFWAAWNCSHAYLHARYHRDTPEPVSIEGQYEPEAQTTLALDWILAGGPEPWCLTLSYGPPHGPYRPLPPGYEGRYDPRALTLPPNCADTPGLRRDLADYYTHVTALDDQVGRLLDVLDDAGTLDETLVVFTSDHGSMLGSHGRKNKHAPWEEATVVPLLLRFGDRLPRGATDDLLLGHVDLAPTLLGLLGIAPDPRMEGRNFASAIGQPAANRPASAYLQAVICADQAQADGLVEWRGVRTHTATYAENLDGPWLLYDNAADPYQLHNLIDDPDAAPLRTALQHELAAWMARTGDVLEPREAVLARLGKTALWEQRAAHFAKVRGPRRRPV